MYLYINSTINTKTLRRIKMFITIGIRHFSLIVALHCNGRLNGVIILATSDGLRSVSAGSGGIFLAARLATYVRARQTEIEKGRSSFSLAVLCCALPFSHYSILLFVPYFVKYLSTPVLVITHLHFRTNTLQFGLLVSLLTI